MSLFYNQWSSFTLVVWIPNLKFKTWMDSTTYLDHHWEISSHAELKSNSQLWNDLTNDCSLMSSFTNSNIFLLTFLWLYLKVNWLFTMINVTAVTKVHSSFDTSESDRWMVKVTFHLKYQCCNSFRKQE